MNYQEKKYSLIFKLAQIYLGLTFVLVSFDSFSQIPKRAISIADSVCQTRMLCTNTNIQLEDSIFYPIFKNKYQDRKTESYFFIYKVHLTDDIVTDLNISIEEDFSIKYVSGLPDKTYNFSPCKIMTREKLWQIAKQKGLKTKYRKCVYYLDFNEKGIFIRFLERKSRYNVDHYTINATTGKYLGHTKVNVCF